MTVHNPLPDSMCVCVCVCFPPQKEFIFKVRVLLLHPSPPLSACERKDVLCLCVDRDDVAQTTK